MTGLRRLAQADERLRTWGRDQLHRYRRWRYLRSPQRPWSTGYEEHREHSLRQALENVPLLESLRAGRPLPRAYGFRLDERVIEIPWALGHLAEQRGRLLDAGSALNRRAVFESGLLATWKTTIVTLAPEAVAFWNLGVSYVFGDLRHLDFRDSWFDAITCISTIEHVGMDNAMYGAVEATPTVEGRDFFQAVRELKRVLRPGGIMLITFPFGKHTQHGFFQQFDAPLMDELIAEFSPASVTETIFRYHPEGWRLSDRNDASACEYFDVRTSKYWDPASTVEYPSDYTAGIRAVACVRLLK